MPHPNGPLAEMGDGHPRSDEFTRRERAISPTILLCSGRYFDFSAPMALTLDEVAHALSHLCRFTGHCARFYSVAQHAVLVSYLVPPVFAYMGLHHDDVETVVGDMASPLKKLIPEYKALEHRMERVILAGFGINSDAMPPDVKHADLVALRTEQRDLMHPNGGLWTSLQGIAPLRHVKVDPWSSEEARRRFVLRHYELVAKQAAGQDSHFQAVA